MATRGTTDRLPILFISSLATVTTEPRPCPAGWCAFLQQPGLQRTARGDRSSPSPVLLQLLASQASSPACRSQAGLRSSSPGRSVSRHAASHVSEHISAAHPCSRSLFRAPVPLQLLWFPARYQRCSSEVSFVLKMPCATPDSVDLTFLIGLEIRGILSRALFLRHRLRSAPGSSMGVGPPRGPLRNSQLQPRLAACPGCLCSRTHLLPARERTLASSSSSRAVKGQAPLAPSGGQGRAVHGDGTAELRTCPGLEPTSSNPRSP